METTTALTTSARSRHRIAAGAAMAAGRRAIRGSGLVCTHSAASAASRAAWLVRTPSCSAPTRRGRRSAAQLTVHAPPPWARLPGREQVVEDFDSRAQVTLEPVHIINVETRDNPDEAEVAAQQLVSLCRALDGKEDLDSDVHAVLDDFMARTGRAVLHSLAYY